jgi:IS605 OrfB family transposase
MSDETYVRTVCFRTPHLTAAKAGKINRAMKDYRRARELACTYFDQRGTDDFSYSDREALRKRINAHDRVDLSARAIYPAIKTVEQNYGEYEKAQRASPPEANRADTLGLEGQNTRLFCKAGTYYLVVHTGGPGYISAPLVTGSDRYHSDRLPAQDAVPATSSSQQRIPGTAFADLDADAFPASTVGLSSSTLTTLDSDRCFQANLVFELHKPVAGGPSADDARYVVGVDRGRNHLAYAALYDQQDDHVLDWWNYSGDEIEHRMDEYADRIAECQQAGVYEEMERLRTRRARHKRQLDYEVANAVVDLARERFGCAIAIEELSGMGRLGGYRAERRRFNQWSYYRLAQYIEQKAEPFDLPVVEVDPAYTSQQCSRCGDRGDTDRRSVHFHCTACGYEQNADANAAVNIAKVV